MDSGYSWPYVKLYLFILTFPLSMNFIHKLLISCTITGAALTGCNDIAPEDRFIDLPVIEGDRVVLLEDYTGQKCPNCPDGARIIEQLEAQYGNRLIAVSIHAGEFAVPVDYNRYLGLMQSFGNEMAKERGVKTYPSGAIDGKSPFERDQWAAQVREAMAVPSTCDISIENIAYNAENARLTGEIALLPGSTCSGLLGVWLIEDGIVARQYNVNGDNTWTLDYIHNHVMRAYFGENPFGNPVSLSRDETVEVSFNFPIDESWDISNLSVVAFVKNAETGSYMQSAISYFNREITK